MRQPIKINSEFIIDEIKVCPYCMDTPHSDALGCCGESSDHFETAYVTRDLDTWLASDVEIVDQEEAV